MKKLDRNEDARGRGRRVTSYDVARLAGVSQSAVSRCFKPGASISEAMRGRVLAAAEQLGYQPNYIARSLITRRSDVIAVIISDLTNLYLPELLTRLTQQVNRAGKRMMLLTVSSGQDLARALDSVWQYQVDGVIAATEMGSDEIREFSLREVPVVFYNRRPRGAPVNAVCCDHLGSERIMVDSLLDAGHKTFAIVSGPQHVDVSRDRVRAALTRLAERGVRNAQVVPGDYSYESGRKGFARMMLGRGAPPDAIICANDIMAIGCIDAARGDFGMRVPEQISVVGFDGSEPSRWASYDLTTVLQPVARMAEAAVDMLLARIENADLETEVRMFSGELLERSSARLAPLARSA